LLKINVFFKMVQSQESQESQELTKLSLKLKPKLPNGYKNEPALVTFIEKIKSEEQKISSSFIQIGKYLSEIKVISLHKAMYTSWEDFISENFQFSARYSYRMMAIANDQDLVERKELGISKLIELLSYTPEERTELLNSNSDINDDNDNEEFLLDQYDVHREELENGQPIATILDPITSSITSTSIITPIQLKKLRDLPVNQFKTELNKNAIKQGIKTPEDLLKETQSELLNYLGKFEAMVIRKKEDVNLMKMQQKEEILRAIKTLQSHLSEMQRMIVSGLK